MSFAQLQEGDHQVVDEDSISIDLPHIQMQSPEKQMTCPTPPPISKKKTHKRT